MSTHCAEVVKFRRVSAAIMEEVLQNKSLVTFFLSAIVFFVCYRPYLYYPPETVGAAVLKALPVWSLAVYIMPPMPLPLTIGQRNVVKGLYGSCIADMGLAWSNVLLVPRLLSFSFAHLFYLMAFYNCMKSSKSRRESWSFPMFLVLAVTSWMAIHDKVPEVSVQCFFIGYSTLLLSMCWMATMCYEYERTWKTLAGCLGTVSFLLSNALIGIDRCITPCPFGEGLALITYYLAQLGIALSAK